MWPDAMVVIVLHRLHRIHVRRTIPLFEWIEQKYWCNYSISTIVPSSPTLHHHARDYGNPCSPLNNQFRQIRFRTALTVHRQLYPYHEYRYNIDQHLSPIVPSVDQSMSPPLLMVQ